MKKYSTKFFNFYIIITVLIVLLFIQIYKFHLIPKIIKYIITKLIMKDCNYWVKFVKSIAS